MSKTSKFLSRILIGLLILTFVMDILGSREILKSEILIELGLLIFIAVMHQILAKPQLSREQNKRMLAVIGFFAILWLITLAFYLFRFR